LLILQNIFFLDKNVQAEEIDHDLHEGGALEEPTPGPSGLQGKRKRSKSSSSTLSFIEARNENIEDVDISALNHPYHNGQVIYSDQENNLELVVRKKRHERETNYLEDHLFEINIREKETKKQQRPLLINLLLIFKAALIALLNDLAQFYDQRSNHQMYITVIDDNIQHGLNTGNFNINADPELVTTTILNMLYNYLTSNLSLRLSNSFRFNIKVLSLRHARDRVQRGNLNPHVLHGSFKQGSKKKYLFYLPEGFEGYETVFSQNCLLISIILGHYLNKALEIEQDFEFRTYNQFKNISSENKLLQRDAGLKLLAIAKKVCRELGLDMEGPHSLEELAPKISQYYNEQIIVFDNVHFNQIVYRYPSIFDECKSQIYLFQEMDKDLTSHIYLISHIRGFERENGTTCMFCEKIFLTKCPRHVCKKREICKSCNKFLLLPQTKISMQNKNLYCKQEQHLPCAQCPAIALNAHCQKLHKCKGFECQKCGYFINKRSHLSVAATKIIHQCGDFFCMNCKKYANKSDEHICQLKRTNFQQNQPALGFFKLQIVDEGNADCFACYEKMNVARQELGFEWDEMIARQELDEKLKISCVCDVHLSAIPSLKKDRYPNLAVLKIETDTRGTFHTRVFAEPSLDQLQNESFDVDKKHYTNLKISRNPIPKYFGKKYKGPQIQQDNLEKMQNRPNKTVMEMLFTFILTAQFYNTTLICFGAEEILLAYKTFLDNGLQCSTISRGQKIILIEYEKFHLRIIDLSNYFPGQIHDLIKLFDLKMCRSYFPMVLNQKANYNIYTLTPNEFPAHLYYNFTDSKEEKLEKLKFWQSLQMRAWNFQEELKINCLKHLDILMQASFKFAQQCHTFQANLGTIMRRKQMFTLPFAKPFCTVSSFFYQVFKAYFMDHKENIYIVPHEHPKKIQSSKEEKEFAAYLQHQNGSKVFNNAFSAINKRNFGRAVPDIYCEETNSIWFFNECIIHGHDPKVCPITTKKKIHKCFGRTFESLNLEFEEKLKAIRDQFVNVTVIWQCEWKKEKKTNQDLRDFLQKIYVPWPTHHLSPREAVRGARIETFGLRWTGADSEEKLYYIDCSSLYPYAG